MVAVVTCTKFKDTRVPALRNELERVGLLDRVEWFWGLHDSPYDLRLANSVRLGSTITNMRNFLATMDHYRVLKTFLGRGMSHVLVLEDDVRFLKDEVHLGQVVADLPESFDYAKFEWNRNWYCRQHNVDPRHPSGGARWTRHDDFDSVGAAAYAVSRKGAEWRVAQLERPALYTELHAALEAVDQYDISRSMRGLEAFLAWPMAAVQMDYPDCNNGGSRRLYKPYLVNQSLEEYAS